jgi:peptide/nickel transport system permease protein
VSRYIARRLLQSIPIFFGITLISYLLMTLSGNPVLTLVMQPEMTQEQIARTAARLGVNDPWPIQYLRWLLGDDWMRWDANGDGIADHAFLVPLDPIGDGKPEPGTRRGILRGDFGDSFSLKRPVLDLLLERLPATLEISLTSFIIGIIGGILLGIVAAVKRGGLIDNALRMLSAIFNAIPIFWLGLLSLLVFAVQLHILPLGDRCSLTMADTCPPIYERLQYMVLPVAMEAVGLIAGLTRLMRASMLDVIGEDYIRTARAKGLRERGIWLVHAARNALIPIATGLGPAITGLIGGSVIIEQIFNYPGVGRTLFQAAVGRDYPVVMASVIYAAVATIVGYLLSDILYTIIDPRIQFS